MAALEKLWTDALTLLALLGLAGVFGLVYVRLKMSQKQKKCRHA